MTSVNAAVTAKSARTAIFVLGMHRSGTSAFTRVANLLGCSLPDHVMQADEGNDLGFWESNAVVALNDELLASAGSGWDDWLPLNEGWSKSTIRAEFFDRAREVLLAEYGTSPLFVLKDPRICRLAPFWIEVLKSLEIRPVIALPQRNPYEVADSLAERDGSDRGLGLLLWLRHTLEAEAATRDLPRYFFSYDQLLNDWTKVAEGFERAVDIRFPGRSVLTEEKISAFLTQDARHHREAGSEALTSTAPAWVGEAYAIMLKWCDGNCTSDDVARLDAISAEFDVAAPSISRIIRVGVSAGDGVGSAGRARRELMEANAELERLRESLNAAELAADALRHQLATGGGVAKQAVDELAELGSALRQRQEEAAQAWAELNTERQLRERADAELHRALAQNERLLDRFGEFEERIRADAREIVNARAQANKTLQVISSLQREHDETIGSREAEIERLRARTDRADTELAQLTLLFAESQARLREIEASIQARHEPEPEPVREPEVTSLNGGSPIAALQTKQIEWLRDVTALLRNTPAWWALLPVSARKKHESALLKTQGLFDSAAYLECHPDVAREGMDPLFHYLNHGIFEGREW